MARRLVTLALVGTALAGTGCHTDDANNASSARGTLAGFLRTCNRREGRLAQQLVVPAAQQRFIGAGGTAPACAGILGLDPRASLGGARIASVRAADGVGQALLTLGAERVRVNLWLTRDGWRVEGSSRSPA